MTDTWLLDLQADLAWICADLRDSGFDVNEQPLAYFTEACMRVNRMIDGSVTLSDYQFLDKIRKFMAAMGGKYKEAFGDPK